MKWSVLKKINLLEWLRIKQFPLHLVFLSHLILYLLTNVFDPVPSNAQKTVTHQLPVAPGYIRLILPVDFIFSPSAQQAFELRTKNATSHSLRAKYIRPLNAQGIESTNDDNNLNGKHLIEISEHDLSILKLSEVKEQLQTFDSWIGLPLAKTNIVNKKINQVTRQTYEEIIF